MAQKEQQIKNSIIYFVPVIIGNLLPLLTLPIFTRILSREDYGILALAQVYAFFVTGIANFGLTTGYERNFFESREKREIAGLLYSILIFIIGGFLFLGIITFLFKSNLSSWIIGSPEHADLLFWTYCGTGITGLKTYFLIYFKNTENAKSYVWYTIDENILGVLFSLGMVVFLKIGVIGLVFGPMLASLIIFSVLLIRFLKFLPFNYDKEAFKNSFKISWPLTPSIFFGVIGNQFDKYILGLLTTVGGVGIYNIGQKIANIVFTFMTAIQNVFSPQVYTRMFTMDKNGEESIGKYLTPFLYISVSMGLLISLFSEELIIILTPESYHGAIDIVAILSMLYATYFFGKQPQLIYAKKTFINSILTMIRIGLNVILIIPFIKYWGVIGAAWGTFVSGIISGAIHFAISQRFYRIKWEYKTIGFIFLIFFISTMAMIIMRNYDVSYFIRIISKIVTIGIYSYLGYKINVLSKQNFLLLKLMILQEKNRFMKAIQ